MVVTQVPVLVRHTPDVAAVSARQRVALEGGADGGQSWRPELTGLGWRPELEALAKHFLRKQPQPQRSSSEGAAAVERSLSGGSGNVDGMWRRSEPQFTSCTASCARYRSGAPTPRTTTHHWDGLCVSRWMLCRQCCWLRGPCVALREAACALPRAASRLRRLVTPRCLRDAPSAEPAAAPLVSRRRGLAAAASEPRSRPLLRRRRPSDAADDTLRSAGRHGWS